MQSNLWNNAHSTTYIRTVKTANVLIVDSGLGGLSIAREIMSLRPDCNYCYLADNSQFPYGLMSEQALTQRLCDIIENALKTYPSDIIVIACNTASTIALEQLRKQFSMPIVGVVPAIKPAAQLTQTGHIGLLATPGTIQRQYIDKLIKEHAADKSIHKIGSNKLVEIAESAAYSGKHLPQLVKNELAPWFSSGRIEQIDVLILACTHFPLIRDLLHSVLPEHIQLLDSGAAIARRTDSLLKSVTATRAQTTNRAIVSSTQILEPQKMEFLRHFGFETVREL